MPKKNGLTSPRAAVWEDVYESRGIDGVSWFQAFPQMSVDLIMRLRLKPDAQILDVGGGASYLVDKLIARGCTALTVIDVSQTALKASRQRLADSDSVTWINEDLLTWQPDRHYDVWHDRAVFHFLTEQSERDAYVRQLRVAIHPGGSVIIGAFSLNGPDQCSGLPVVKYSSDALMEALGPDFDVVETRKEVHVTPQGTRQAFTWVVATADVR